MKNKLLPFYITLFVMSVLLSTAGAAPESEQKCLICHGKVGFKKVESTGQVRHLFVDTKALSKSVHKGKQCTDCHFDVRGIPHKKTPEKVQCVRCHYNGSPEGVPESDAYLAYEKSVHGRELAAGNEKAPACQDCHGDHKIKHVKDDNSVTSHGLIAETCGKCHMKEYAEYTGSVHGRAVEEGIEDAPTCTGCHGEHSIEKSEREGSSVYVKNISKLCSDCHSVESVVGKYGIEVEQVATFQDSFHGVANKFGSKTVANCSSCHGVHNILEDTNPQSSVHPDNIPTTCGKEGCHPGANANYAKGKIHVNVHSKDAGIIYWIALFFKYLTISVMCGLLGHIALDFYRKLRKGKYNK